MIELRNEDLCLNGWPVAVIQWLQNSSPTERGVVQHHLSGVECDEDRIGEAFDHGREEGIQDTVDAVFAVLDDAQSEIKGLSPRIADELRELLMEAMP